jgi:hypothetical protein
MSAASRSARLDMSSWPERLAAADHRAYLIADAAAVADIESSCPSSMVGGQRWHDTRPMLDEREHCSEVIDMARQALDHAAERGLIERRLSEPHLVRIKLTSHQINQQAA